MLGILQWVKGYSTNNATQTKTTTATSASVNAKIGLTFMFLQSDQMPHRKEALVLYSTRHDVTKRHEILKKILILYLTS